MISSRFKSPLLKALILSSAMLATGAASQAFAQKFKPKAEENWTTYKNERFGYQLYYPAAIFTPQAPDDEDETEAADAQEADNAEPATGSVTAQANPAPAPAPNAQAESDDEGDDDEEDGDDEDDDAEDGEDDADDTEDDDADDEEEGDDEEDDGEEEDGDAADTDAGDGKTLTLLSKDGKAKIVTFAALNEDRVSPAEYRKILLDEFGGYDKLDYQPAGKSWFVLSGYRGDSIYYQKVMFSCSNRVVNVYSINFPTAEKPYYERLIEVMEDNFKTGRGTDTPANC